MATFFLFDGVCRTKENVAIHCYAESRNLKSAALAISEPSEATMPMVFRLSVSLMSTLEDPQLLGIYLWLLLGHTKGCLY